jgi:hypothetical protein
MALDNVVPIDAEAAQHLEQRRARFRWFVVALTATWIAVLVPVLVLSPLPPLWPFVAMAILVVLAEHRFVLFGDETSMSASIVVVVASIFVFADTSPLAGPMLIASFGGLYLPHIVGRNASVLAANSTTYSLSVAIAAGLTHTVLGNGNGPGRALLAALIATTTYWNINSFLTGFAAALRNGAIVTNSIWMQFISDLPVFLLALGSSLLAQFASAAAVIVPMMVFEVHLRLRASGARPRPWAPPIRFALASGAVGAMPLAVGGTSGYALLALGTYVCHALARAESRPLWHLGFATGWACITALAMSSVGWSGELQLLTAMAVSTLSVFALDVRRLSIAAGTKLGRVTLFGLMLPSRHESTLAAVALGLAPLVVQLERRWPGFIVGLLGVFMLVALALGRPRPGHAWKRLTAPQVLPAEA